MDGHLDEYGNTEDEIINCCFPDCGCDGSRNCMAKNGANNCSLTLNLEKGSAYFREHEEKSDG